MDETRKKVIILFCIIVFSFLVDILASSIAIKIIAALLYFALSIAVFVYSIKLIKMKDYAFGITFLVLSSFVILLFLVAFLVGFIVGLSQSLENGTITGSVVASMIK
jgi:hypothetical protein